MEKFQDKQLEWLLLEIRKELAYAQNKFSKYNSSHEGFAVIAEELDELWDEVKAKPYSGKNERMTREAIQVATTAIRFVLDVSLPASQEGKENVA